MGDSLCLALSVPQHLTVSRSLRAASQAQSTSNVVRSLGLGICPSTSHNHILTHTHTHSLSLVLVAVMKPKELKTKISRANSLILSQTTFSQVVLLSGLRNSSFIAHT